MFRNILRMRLVASYPSRNGMLQSINIKGNRRGSFSEIAVLTSYTACSPLQAKCVISLRFLTPKIMRKPKIMSQLNFSSSTTKIRPLPLMELYEFACSIWPWLSVMRYSGTLMSACTTIRADPKSPYGIQERFILPQNDPIAVKLSN